MAFSLIANTGAGGTANTVTTGSIDTTGADLLVVAVSQVGAAGTLTDSKGNTWSALTQQVAGGGAASRLYYCYGGTVGSGHTFTYSGTAIYPSIAVTAWLGAAASPFDQETGNTATSGSTIAPGSLTPSQNDCVVITGFQADAVSYSSIDGGFTASDTVTYSAGNHEAGGMAYLIQTSAAAANPTWTMTGSSSYLSAVMASFKLAAVGGANPKGPLNNPLCGPFGGAI